jgi:ribosomal protein S1
VILVTDHWNEFVRRRPVGETLRATVTKVLPFGALVEVSEGVHGLLVQERRPPVGATISVRVVEIDDVKQRVKFVAA